MDRLNHFLSAALCSVFIWLSVVAVRIVGDSAKLTSFAVMLAFLGTLAIWIVMGLAQAENVNKPGQEKTKRDSANGDARLALLLSLLGEDERQSIKQRLMDGLGADGETVSLAELLAAENEQQRHS